MGTAKNLTPRLLSFPCFPKKTTLCICVCVCEFMSKCECIRVCVTACMIVCKGVCEGVWECVFDCVQV